jgi:aryl-alcohol dehydrogenase-like predicted oxidoreductase
MPLIPDTTLDASPICLGTALFGKTVSEADSYALLDACLERGGNFLDTAKVYADWLPGEKSSSEKTLGRWIKKRNNRDRLVLATKGAHLDLATRRSRLARAEIESDLADSLAFLQTDRIDLYWLHRDDVARPVADIMDTLADQVQAGRIRYFGCSNWTLPRIREAQAYARGQRQPGFVANQMKWSLAVPDPKAGGDPTMVAMDRAMHAFHRETGLAAVPFSSQAGGWFQKRDKAGAPVPGSFATEANERRFQAARAIAAETGLTLTQIVLGYLLSQPFATFPIVGSHTLEQLEDCLSASAVRLTAEQMQTLDQAASP